MSRLGQPAAVSAVRGAMWPLFFVLGNISTYHNRVACLNLRPYVQDLTKTRLSACLCEAWCHAACGACAPQKSLSAQPRAPLVHAACAQNTALPAWVDALAHVRKACAAYEACEACVACAACAALWTRLHAADPTGRHPVSLCACQTRKRSGQKAMPCRVTMPMASDFATCWQNRSRPS